MDFSRKMKKLDMTNYNIKEENNEDEISAFDGLSINNDDLQNVNIKLVPDDGSVVSDGTKSFHEPKSKGKPIRGLDYGIDMVKKDKHRGTDDIRSSQSGIASASASKSDSGLPPARENTSNRGGRFADLQKKFGNIVAPLPNHGRRNNIDMTTASVSEDSNGYDQHRGGHYRDNRDRYDEDEGSGSGGSHSGQDNPGLLDEQYMNQIDQDQYQDDNYSQKSGDGGGGDGVEKKRELTYEEIQQKKEDGLAKLSRLQDLGYTSAKTYSMSSELEDIERTVKKLTAQRDLDKSKKFQQKILMGFVTVTEYLNHNFDPFDLKLDGWSEAIYENIADYDEVFEELHEKYKDQISIGPEIKLLGMIAGSAMMFHFSKTLFSKAESQVPGFDQVMNSDPELKRRYQDQASKIVGNNGATNIANNGGNAGPLGMIGQMIGGFTGNNNMGNMFANMMGGAGKKQQPAQNQTQHQQQPKSQPNSKQQQQNQNQNQSKYHQHPQGPQGPHGPQGHQVDPTRKTKRPPMKPVDDVDDLLGSLVGTNVENDDKAILEAEIDISEIDNLSDLSSTDN